MFGMKSVVDLGGSGDVWESRKVRDAQNISLYSIIIYMIVSYTYLYIYILYMIVSYTYLYIYVYIYIHFTYCNIKICLKRYQSHTLYNHIIIHEPVHKEYEIVSIWSQETQPEG